MAPFRFVLRASAPHSFCGACRAVRFQAGAAAWLKQQYGRQQQSHQLAFPLPLQPLALFCTSLAAFFGESNYKRMAGVYILIYIHMCMYEYIYIYGLINFRFL